MKFVLMSLLLAGSSLAMDDMFKKIMKETAFHTFNAACFGENNKNLYDLAVGAAMEKCMQLAPAIDLINLLSPRNQFNSLFPSVNRKNPFEQFQVNIAMAINQNEKMGSFFSCCRLTKILTS